MSRVLLLTAAYFFLLFHAMSRSTAPVTVLSPAFLAARARACCAVAALLLRSLARALFSTTRFRSAQAVTGVISPRASAVVILRPVKSERSSRMKQGLQRARMMGFPLQKRLTCLVLPHLGQILCVCIGNSFMVSRVYGYWARCPCNVHHFFCKWTRCRA